MKKGLIYHLVLLLILIPFLGMWSSEAAAAVVPRIATLTQWKGSVYVNLAGGSQQFKAYKNMSLRQGDMITTGEDSSAILQFANGTSTDDSITIGANTTITLSKLANTNGTRTKVSLLNGSAWVDVRSIVNKDDEFRLETSTSIMEVRGTHFIANVDPRTGDTRLGVLAGIVQVQSSQQNDRNDHITQNVYPGMQSYVPSDSTVVPPTAPIDLENIMSLSSPQIIQQLLNHVAQIQEENRQLIEQISQSGIPLDLGYLDDEALERYRHNIQHQISFILQNVMNRGAITQEEVEDLIRQVNENTNTTIDLNQRPQISDREREQQERLQQLQQERQQRVDQERLERESFQEQSRRLIEQIEQERERQQKANEEARQRLEQQARDRYRNELAQEERDRFDLDQRAREQERQEANPAPPARPETRSPNESAPHVEPEEPWEPTYPEEPTEPEWYIDRPFDVVTSAVYAEPRYLNLNSDQVYYLDVDLEQSTVVIKQYGNDSPFKVVSVKKLGEDYALNDGYFEIDLKVGTNELLVKVLDESSGYTHEYRFNIYCNELPFGALGWNIIYDSVKWFFKKSDDLPDTNRYEVHILEGIGPVFFEFFMLEPVKLSRYFEDSEELEVLEPEYDGNDKYTFGPVEFGTGGRIHRYLLEMEYSDDTVRSYELIVFVEKASVE